MRLTFSESDIDPQTQLSPAANEDAASHRAAKDPATGWVDPNKTHVVPTADLAAWHARANPTKDRAKDAEDDATDSNDPKTFLGLSIPQVVGGVLASTTAAILGANLGLAGSVVGAAMTTGIITVGGAIYSHLINKFRLGARDAGFRFGAKSGQSLQKNASGKTAGTTKAPRRAGAIGGLGRSRTDESTTDRKSWRAKISPVKLIATAATIFLLAGVIVTGLEVLRGGSFAGGDQTTVSQINQRSTTNEGTSRSSNPAPSAAKPTTSPTAAAPTANPTPASQPTPTTAAQATPPPSGDTSTGSGSSGAGANAPSNSSANSDSSSAQNPAAANPNGGTGQ